MLDDRFRDPANFRKKQRFCYFIPQDAYVTGYGWRVSIVREGVAGHSPTGTWPYKGGLGEVMPYFWGPARIDAEKQAVAQNKLLGLTEQDVHDIVLSSMGDDVFLDEQLESTERSALAETRRVAERQKRLKRVIERAEKTKAFDLDD